MKQVILIRHAHKKGDEVTPQGINASKTLAKNIDTVHLVITSERNRAMQTAGIVTGLGIEVDKRANPPAWPDELKGHILAIQKTHPLGAVGAIWDDQTLIDLAKEAGEKLLELIKETFGRIVDDERALIVSHDGTIIAFERLLEGGDFNVAPTHTFSELSGLIISEDLTMEFFNE